MMASWRAQAGHHDPCLQQYMRSIYPPGLLQVYVVGEVGIMEELELKGIQALGGPEDAGKTVELKAGYAMPHDKDVSLPVDGNAVSGRCGLVCIQHIVPSMQQTILESVITGPPSRLSC